MRKSLIALAVAGSIHAQLQATMPTLYAPNARAFSNGEPWQGSGKRRKPKQR